MASGNGRRNIANRKDIEPDALRQRRDLYALAIGLVIFNLAGGHVVDAGTVGNLIPVKLKYPQIILVVAWLGFFYFWIRFWLVSEAKPWDDFMEDARWQAGHSRIGRRLASSVATASSNWGQERTPAQNAASLLDPNGPVPAYFLDRWKPTINLDQIGRKAPRNGVGVSNEFYGGRHKLKARRDVFTFWAAYLLGILRATYRERSFSDNSLPHFFAMFTVLTGIGHGVVYGGLFQ